MTLPLIYALSQAEKPEKRRILRMIKRESHKAEKVQEVIEFVRRSGGIDYTRQTMEKYYQEALRMLDSFTDSPYKNALIELLGYTIERKK